MKMNLLTDPTNNSDPKNKKHPPTQLSATSAGVKVSVYNLVFFSTKILHLILIYSFHVILKVVKVLESSSTLLYLYRHCHGPDIISRTGYGHCFCLPVILRINGEVCL